jgi:RNA polymerase sigma factor (sigma-70 family)
MGSIKQGRTDPGGLATRAGRAFADFRTGQMGRMDELVQLLTPLLWHTARSQGLGRDAAADVVQICWLRLVEHADRIDDPQAVLGWLIVTVRREAWRQVKVGDRTRADGLQPDDDRASDEPDPGETAVLTDEQRLLWRHLAELPERCQSLLRLIAFTDHPDYATVAEALQMPVGSIGPTRGRCLAKLRSALLEDPSWGGL